MSLTHRPFTRFLGPQGIVARPPLTQYHSTMQTPVAPAEPCPTSEDGERARFLQAVAQGLADDAAGRTMDTRALRVSLEEELGPIAWP